MMHCMSIHRAKNMTTYEDSKLCKLEPLHI